MKNYRSSLKRHTVVEIEIVYYVLVLEIHSVEITHVQSIPDFAKCDINVERSLYCFDCRNMQQNHRSNSFYQCKPKRSESWWLVTMLETFRISSCPALHYLKVVSWKLNKNNSEMLYLHHTRGFCSSHSRINV